ncbi:unnamed protein product [Ceutorhynchus assimilis]|uniref:Uncharacterized protein n=1 Tax=Ceutorhynchus assimilis TaxID=467358 RepID=A0A9N9MGG7_9CUCU|nr:unnamed protein product [Ceutorhynchus assimilis]
MIALMRYSIEDLREDEEGNFTFPEITKEEHFPNHSAPPTPNPQPDLNDSSEEQSQYREEPKIPKPNKHSTNTLGTPRISRARINSLRDRGDKNEDKKKTKYKNPRQ